MPLMHVLAPLLLLLPSVGQALLSPRFATWPQDIAGPEGPDREQVSDSEPLNDSPATVRLRPEELALAARVDEGRAARTVRELVAQGTRMGGTRSGERARDLRQTWAAAAGLRVEVYADGEVDAYEPLRWRVVAKVGGRRRDLLSAWPMVGAPALEATDLVLDTDEGAGGALLSRSGSGGAHARVLLADGRSTQDGRYAQVRPQSRAGAPIFGLGRDDGRFLREALDGSEPVTLDVLLECEARRAMVDTVVAVLPAASGSPPGHLLFCAHGDADSGGPGANDNASGEAIVLEIARAWAQSIADGRLPAPGVELRFAWWGSEIFSSRAYVKRALDDLENPLLGVLNFDQCGFGAGPERLYLEPDDLPANVDLLNIGLRVLNDAGGADGFPEQFATVRSLGGTDSYVFSGNAKLAERGVPALTIYASAWGRPAAQARTDGMPGEAWHDAPSVSIDYDPWYHSAGDLPELTTDLEPWHLGWQARVGAITGLRLAEALAGQD